MTGHEVVIVMNGLRACGQGCALTNVPLVQSKSYFEVRIRQEGVWAVGLATRSTDLNTSTGGNDAECWALNSTGIIRHNKEEVHKVETIAQEGDIIVIFFPISNLSFTYDFFSKFLSRLLWILWVPGNCSKIFNHLKIDYMCSNISN